MERYSELLSLKLDCGDTDSFCGDYKQLREERTKKAMIEDDANKILAQFADDEEKKMFNYALMHYNSASLYMDINGGVYDNVEMKDDILDFVNCHVKMSFRNIISSQECMLDAINETYLYMAFKSEKKVLFTHGMGDN
ncbi:MAG: hypothetical protein LUD12_09140, partial [Lachnospiraceae bacterium]|nr:hypothetical protein [Lachnospiraceae bacterium]